MSFSATGAALEGFRLTRRHPAAVAIWAGLCIVFQFATSGALVSMAGPELTELMAQSQNPAAGADPQAMMALLGPLLMAYLVIIPLALVFGAVISAAVYRAVARPEASAFGFLRVGADELRLLIASVAVGVLMGVAFFVIAIVAVFLVAILGSAAGGGSAAGMAIGILAAVLIYLSMFVVGLALYVKFSFSGPMTFVEKRIRVFGSWGATRGRFWPLLGAYVLAFVLAILVGLLGWIIGMAVMLAFGGGMQQMTAPDMSSLAAYMTPAMIAYSVVASMFSALTYAILLAPAMAAYQAIHGRAADPSSAFE